MIISRTPFRVSLFGGGTDYPAWFREHGGAVVGFAIDKYCYISLRCLPPFFSHRHRIVYSRIETVNTIAEIEHPSVRACLSELNVDYGVEIHHDGDLPARSGLGSSSSFTVGLLNVLHALNGRMTSKRFLAGEAIRIEQQVIGEHVGSQDQVWAAYGGMNHVEFLADGTFAVRPLIMPTERSDRLLGSLMLFFTGLSRFASEIAASQIANIESKRVQLNDVAAMASEAMEILGHDGRDLRDIGRLLHQSWLVKRALSDSVTNREVDEIYQAAMEAGALGGKLLGAGGGGFMLFYVDPENQKAVRERLKGLIEVDFTIDHDGSKVVVYEPQGLERC
jgi:D-glycero-alpha-D-manno-heptose-7-phosphate kinase